MEKQLLAIGYDSYSNYVKLPGNILYELNQPKFSPPYYFSIESSFGTISFCGVIEFTSDDGIIMVPNGVLENMNVYGSDFVTVRLIDNIPKGQFIQIEPLEKEIYQIHELDKFLEKSISNYCLLYPNQIINLIHQNIKYSILIKSIQINDDIENNCGLIDIVNTDIKIDIYNKFQAEELEEKRKLEEKKINITRDKNIAKISDNLTRANNDTTQLPSQGFILGGKNITDPKIIREIRLRKFTQNTNPIVEKNREIDV